MGKHSTRKKLKDTSRQKSAQFAYRKETKNNKIMLKNLQGLGAIESNGNISENELKIVSTNFSNRLTNDELYELLENIKHQRDFYKIKYEQQLKHEDKKNSSSNIHKSNNQHELMKDQINDALQIQNLDESKSDEISKIEEKSEDRQDESIKHQNQLNEDTWQIRTRSKHYLSKTFQFPHSYKQICDFKSQNSLRVKKCKVAESGVKSLFIVKNSNNKMFDFSDEINKFKLDSPYNKLAGDKHHQNIEIRKLLKEKESLMKELKVKEKLIKEERSKNSMKYSKLNQDFKKAQKEILSYKEIISKQQSKIESQLTEIKDLMIEVEKVDARLHSEMYINERRTQELQNQLIRLKRRAIEKKDGNIAISQSSMDLAVDPNSNYPESPLIKNSDHSLKKDDSNV